jgi:type IV pilus assembly protein PilY1
MLEDAAFYGGGDYTEATTSIELLDALQNAVVTSVEKRGSGAHATQSEIALDVDGHTNLYLTHYDTKDWSGDLIKVQLEEQADHSLSATKIWSAAEKLDALLDPVTSRTIFTPNDSITGLLDFKSDDYTSSLNNSLLELINQELNAEGEFEEAMNIVDYVRGNTSLNSDQYRPRSSLMGDLIHSRATLVKNRNYGYKDKAYTTYVMNNATRQAMIYVGGNDGMLHAFDEATGDEIFAYDRSTSYTENHLYFVDGELSIVDAKLKSGSTLEWATVLASPLGAGYKGLFLLDVSAPSLGLDALRSNLFIWEINNTTEINGTEVFKRMGFIINSPKIVRFRIPDANNNSHDKWVLITGNGVHSKFSDHGKTIIGAATVLIIDLDTGELITELVVDNGFVDQIQSTIGAASYVKFTNGNGITSIAAVDVDSNTYIDRLYAADLKGNLWRFDYDDNGTILGDDAAYINANLKVAYETSGGLPGPIFTASGGEHPKPYTGSYSQPITAELTVTTAPASSEVREGEMVFFGTGQYFDFTHLLDGINNKVQSMYAFWDRGGWNNRSTPKTRLNLQEQTIVETTVDGKKVRTMPTANSIDFTTKLGWFMDMPAHGERITRKSVGLFEHMAFFTQSPVSNIDPCVEGIDGWSMIAKKDTATPLAFTIASDEGITTNILGNKYTGDSIHDPIFVELSDGQFVAPVIIDAMGNTPTISNTTHIQKDYSRASWKRLQL